MTVFGDQDLSSPSSTLRHLLHESKMLVTKLDSKLPSTSILNLRRSLKQMSMMSQEMLEKQLKVATQPPTLLTNQTIDDLIMKTFLTEQQRLTRNFSSESEKQLEEEQQRILLKRREQRAKEQLDFLIKDDWHKTRDEVLCQPGLVTTTSPEEEERQLDTVRGIHFAKLIKRFNEERAKLTGDADKNDPSLKVPLAQWFIAMPSGNEQVDEMWECIVDLVKGEKTAGAITHVMRECLERSFAKFMDRTVQQFPLQAMAGGNPSIVDRTKAYVNVLLRNNTNNPTTSTELGANCLEYTGSGMPIYAVLYCLVRAGYWQNAIQLAKQEELTRDGMGQYLAIFFDTYVSRKDRESTQASLPSSVKAAIQSEFVQKLALMQQQSQITPVDPYRMTLLKMMGKCDMKKRTTPVIQSSVEDYIWYQLWLVSRNSTNAPSSMTSNNSGNVQYNLPELQKIVRDLGSQYFVGSGINTLLYPQVLLWTCQLEHFLDVLYSTIPALRMDTLHMIIVLVYHGLLKTDLTLVKKLQEPPTSKQSSLKLFEQDQQAYKLLYARLLYEYALSQIAPIDRSMAMHYVVLVSIGAQQKISAIDPGYLMPFIGDDLTYWFGTIRRDGSREPGQLDQLKPLIDPVALMRSAAKCTPDLTDRIHLLTLAGDWLEAMNLLIDVMLMDPGMPEPTALSKQSVTLARSIVIIVKNNALLLSSTTNGEVILQTLEQCLWFFDFKLSALVNKLSQPLIPCQLAEQHLFDLSERRVYFDLPRLASFIPCLLQAYAECVIRLHHMNKEKPVSKQDPAIEFQVAEKTRALLSMASEYQLDPESLNLLIETLKPITI